MTELTLAILVVLGVVSMLDWRKGFAMCVLMGIAQDPLRKLAPQQPVYFVVLVGVIFIVTWIRAAVLRVPLTPAGIPGWKRSLKAPFVVFAFIVIAQALHSFFAYGSAKMTVIGLIVWLSPFPAVLLAFQFTRRAGAPAVRRWMSVYIVAALLALSGVYFEYVGFPWPVLGEIGEGQLIYDVGTVLKAYSGFFRASEIAAWHTATIACFVFILSVGKRPTLMRVAGALGMIALLASLGILTGRRKMLVEITMFISVYLFLVAWLQRGMGRLAMCLLAAGAIAYVVIVGFMAPDLVQRSASKTAYVENAQRIQGYAVRGSSVFADLPYRVNELGVQPVMWAMSRFGWLGAGLGTGSQGTNDVAEAHGVDRGAAEGGLGKIVMELGLPGLAAVIWLIVALGKHLHWQLVFTARASPQHARMSYGLLAFLIANAAAFSVATQAFSDPFILLILGWTLGFLLAMPVLAARTAQGVGNPLSARQSGFYLPTGAATR